MHITVLAELYLVKQLFNCFIKHVFNLCLLTKPGNMLSVSQFDLSQRAKVFKALSDPTRLSIVEFLADGQERTGKDIADAVGITLALLCHHTGTLDEAGLLVKRKQGQSCYHRLDCQSLDECLGSLHSQTPKG